MDWAQGLLLISVVGAFIYGWYTMYQQDKKYKEETGDNW